MAGWVWLVLFVICFSYEMFDLAKTTDPWQPLTYYVKRLMKRPLVWVSVLGFWLWLGWHFFLS